MQAMFGAPSVLESGDTALLVWRLPAPQPTVTSAPAIALVDGGSWSAPSVLPALRALGVPAADRFLERGYLRTTFDRADQVPRLDYPRAVAKEVTNRWKKRPTSSQVDEISDILSQFPSRGWVEAPEALPTR
jgi:hypothetical protein